MGYFRMDIIYNMDFGVFPGFKIADFERQQEYFKQNVTWFHKDLVTAIYVGV